MAQPALSEQLIQQTKVGRREVRQQHQRQPRGKACRAHAPKWQELCVHAHAIPYLSFTENAIPIMYVCERNLQLHLLLHIPFNSIDKLSTCQIFIGNINMCTNLKCGLPQTTIYSTVCSTHIEKTQAVLSLPLLVF